VSFDVDAVAINADTARAVIQIRLPPDVARELLRLVADALGSEAKGRA